MMYPAWWLTWVRREPHPQSRCRHTVIDYIRIRKTVFGGKGGYPQLRYQWFWKIAGNRSYDGKHFCQDLRVRQL